MIIKLQRPFRGPVSEQSLSVQRELANLKQGESILIGSHTERVLVYRAARRIGVTVTTRKLHGKGIGVWRTDLLGT